MVRVTFDFLPSTKTPGSFIFLFVLCPTDYQTNTRDDSLQAMKNTTSRSKLISLVEDVPIKKEVRRRFDSA